MAEGGGPSKSESPPESGPSGFSVVYNSLHERNQGVYDEVRSSGLPSSLLREGEEEESSSSDPEEPYFSSLPTPWAACQEEGEQEEERQHRGVDGEGGEAGGEGEEGPLDTSAMGEMDLDGLLARVAMRHAIGEVAGQANGDGYSEADGS